MTTCSFTYKTATHYFDMHVCVSIYIYIYIYMWIDEQNVFFLNSDSSLKNVFTKNSQVIC
jgi:hypothetical protein